MSSIIIRLPEEIAVDSSMTVEQLNRLADTLGCELRYKNGWAFVPVRELYGKPQEKRNGTDG